MRALAIARAATVALALLPAGMSWAQFHALPVPKEAHDEAERSLPVLRQMVTPETYRKLGFQSAEEAQRATLATPIRILMVRLDRLREYQAGRSAGELLEDTHEVRYPVSVEGQVRSSVVMHEVNGKWQVAKFGRPLLTTRLTEIVRKRNERSPTPPESFFEVKIPALQLDFLGRTEGTNITLTPTVDDPEVGLKEGEEIDAQQVFARLAPRARELKTGPYLSD